MPVDQDGQSGSALVITSPMVELNNVEQAVQAHQYLRMIGSDLRGEFFFYFLVATIGLLLLACLMGVRIGFGVTHPLDDLVQRNPRTRPGTTWTTVFLPGATTKSGC